MMTSKSKYWQKLIPHLVEIRERFDSGVQIKDIGEEFGIDNAQKVSEFLEVFGMSRKQPSSEELLTPHRDDILRKLHDERMLMSEVAAEYNTYSSTISSMRKKWLGKGWYPLAGSKLNKHQDDIITRWFNDQSIDDIAIVYNVHSTSIYCALKRWQCFMGY